MSPLAAYMLGALSMLVLIAVLVIWACLGTGSRADDALDRRDRDGRW